MPPHTGRPRGCGRPVDHVGSGLGDPSMRPRGQTLGQPPRMRSRLPNVTPAPGPSFNEAAGAEPWADPADASRERPTTTGRPPCFNEAAGADPADAPSRSSIRSGTRYSFNEAAGADPRADPADAREEGPRPRRPASRFNEAAGADPADAPNRLPRLRGRRRASMRPRGQTPRMRDGVHLVSPVLEPASMRPRGQTPRMRLCVLRVVGGTGRFNEAAGADPADAALPGRPLTASTPLQ